ncbi:porin family protein [Marinilabiliaceae bacterium ANBcel2]|nr:porin family protein [Marinilabiliaceae bacterium ANBcel2]
MAIAVFCSANSFSQGGFKFGGGLSLGTEADAGDAGIGISPRAAYIINEDFTVASNFTYWFTDSDITFWALNADLHYTFAGDESLSFYGLAGLNYSNYDIDFEESYNGIGNISISGSDSEIGLNIGAGANMGMFFGEIKYETTYDGQLVLSAGVLF